MKPNNILVTSTGQPKIIDFGLAKQLIEQANPLTQFGGAGVMGTVGYMSPEQAAGDSRNANEQTDIYTLGVILLKILELKQEMSKTKINLSKALIDEQLPEQKTQSSIPPRLQNIVNRASAEKQSDRYPSVADLINDLRAYNKPLTTKRTPISFIKGIAVLSATFMSLTFVFWPTIKGNLEDMLGSAISRDAWRSPRSEDENEIPKAFAESPTAPVLDLLLNGKIPFENVRNLQIALEIYSHKRSGPNEFGLVKDGDKLNSLADESFCIARPLTEGYLYVFQIDSRGNVAWHYPHQKNDASAKLNPVKDGEIVQIPLTKSMQSTDAVNLNKNEGLQQVYAIFSSKSWAELERKLSSAVFQSTASESIAKNEDDRLDLTGKLKSRGIKSKDTYKKPSPTEINIETKSGQARLPIVGHVRESTGKYLFIERWFMQQ